jgi:3-hydroxyacyl-CoA dehydrogenase
MTTIDNKTLTDIKGSTSPLLQNAVASLWDIGNGVACLEFHTKMNAMEGAILDLIDQALIEVDNNLAALVLYNEGRAFCAGANLSHFANWIKKGDISALQGMLGHGQQTYMTIKQAPFPVVAGAHGYALGGGCEIALHCDAIVARQDLHIGLVELAVGLVPAWGGCKEMLLRNQSTDDAPLTTLIPISTARVSKNAEQAREMRILKQSDETTQAPDRLLLDCKKKALALMPSYAPPGIQKISLPGVEGKISLDAYIVSRIELNKCSEYDALIMGKLAHILTGGAAIQPIELDELDILKLEFEAFMQLAEEPATLERIEHMINTGKRLFN